MDLSHQDRLARTPPLSLPRPHVVLLPLTGEGPLAEQRMVVVSMIATIHLADLTPTSERLAPSGHCGADRDP